MIDVTAFGRETYTPEAAIMAQSSMARTHTAAMEINNVKKVFDKTKKVLVFWVSGIYNVDG